MDDHYETLGVSPNADAAVIQAAYRALMRIHHPDTNQSSENSDRAVALNAAFANLSDPIRRRGYDAERHARASGEQPIDAAATSPGRPATDLVSPAVSTPKPQPAQPGEKQEVAQRLHPGWTIFFVLACGASVVPLLLQEPPVPTPLATTAPVERPVAEAGAFDAEADNYASSQFDEQVDAASNTHGSQEALDAISGVDAAPTPAAAFKQ